MTCREDIDCALIGRAVELPSRWRLHLTVQGEGLSLRCWNGPIRDHSQVGGPADLS
jgi:hypothetical protein